MRIAPRCFLLAVLFVLAGCESPHEGTSESASGILYVLTAHGDAFRDSFVRGRPAATVNWEKFDEETARIVVDDCPRDFQRAWQAYRAKINEMVQMHPDEPMQPYGSSAEMDVGLKEVWQGVKDSAQRHGVIFNH